MTAKRAASLASVLVALFGVASASAADLPRRRAAPAPAYEPPPPAFLWNGFYAGVQGGWGFADFQGSGGRALVSGANGGLIGLTGGYNYQLSPNFLIGAEADFSFAWIGTDVAPLWGVAARGNTDDILTIRGRAGYVMDRALIFATAGFAGSRNSISVAGLGFAGYQSSFQPGWALGAGVEYLVTPNVSAKGEYLYTSTGSDTYFASSPFQTYSGVDQSTVRGGVNYHF
ncbi:MAG: outer membrane protein [Methylocystis sp.]|uniref:outer membrane protein n=1 Tax=Methylocystis sp. TaxID=1911079 RepID=UPI003DA5BBD7